jgi:hypothetical protein
MKTKPYEFRSDTLAHLVTVLGDEGRLNGLMAKKRVLPDDWYQEPGDPSAPPLRRLAELLRTFEEHIRIVAAQREELGCPEYAKQAEGEIVATVIAIREIWDQFPELWDHRDDVRTSGST